MSGGVSSGDSDECVLLLFLFITTPLTGVDKVLTYVVEAFGSVMRLTIPVPCHQIPEAGSGADVSRNYVENLSVVGFSPMSFYFPARAGLFLVGLLIPLGPVIVAMAP